jgi:hypothetical protein
MTRGDLWWLPEYHPFLLRLRAPLDSAPLDSAPPEWRGGIHPALRAPVANDNGQAWGQR